MRRQAHPSPTTSSPVVWPVPTISSLLPPFQSQGLVYLSPPVPLVCLAGCTVSGDRARRKWHFRMSIITGERFARSTVSGCGCVGRLFSERGWKTGPPIRGQKVSGNKAFRSLSRTLDVLQSLQASFGCNPTLPIVISWQELPGSNPSHSATSGLSARRHS